MRVVLFVLFVLFVVFSCFVDALNELFRVLVGHLVGGAVALVVVPAAPLPDGHRERDADGEQGGQA